MTAWATQYLIERGITTEIATPLRNLIVTTATSLGIVSSITEAQCIALAIQFTPKLLQPLASPPAPQRASTSTEAIPMDVLPTAVMSSSTVNPADFKNYPFLRSTAFVDILDFADILGSKLREVIPTPDPPTHVVVAPAVAAAYQAYRHPNQPTDLPTDARSALRQLFAAFAPESSAARLDLLRLIKFKSPGAADSLASMVLEFNARFTIRSSALQMPDHVSCTEYPRALPAPLARLIRAEALFLGPNHTLSQLQAFSLKAATDAERAQGLGLLTLMPGVGNSPSPPGSSIPPIPSTSSGGRHNRSKAAQSGFHTRSVAPSATPLPPAPVPAVTPTAAAAATGSGIPPTIPKLTPAERERCKTLGLCLRCRLPGHIASECPSFPKAHRVSLESLRASMGAAGPNSILVEAECSLPLPTTTPLPKLLCLIDTGAACSLINEAYAKTLGMPVTPLPQSVTIIGSNGHKEICSSAVQICAHLTPDAPSKPITLILSKTTPPGSYALVGLLDLAGYVINIITPPTITWTGMASLEDQADPVDLPLPDLPVPIHTMQPGPPPPAHVPVPISNDVLTPNQSQQVQTLLNSYADVFGPLTSIPLDIPPFTVQLKPGAQPGHHAARFLNAKKAAIVDREITQLISAGFIRPSSSHYAAPAVIVTKRDGTPRVCYDFWEINDQTVKDSFPIPPVSHLFGALRGNPYMAKFDLTKAYFQAPVDPATSPLLAFVTPKGLYEPTRLPFGVTNGPPYFHRHIGNLFRALLGVTTYFDDCAVAGPTFEEFLSRLQAFLECCRLHHVQLKAEKSIIGPRALPFLGRLVSSTSIEIDPERLESLRTAAAPVDKATLHSFLGLAQWFSSFIPGLATLAAPLTDLLKKFAPWTWDQVQQQAFLAVKAAILACPALAQPVPGYPLILRTDASTIGIGGALFQTTPSNTLELLSLFSRKLLPAESRYATIELEALAVVWCLDKARTMISGPVLIQTDHSNLQFLRSSSNARVQRWSLILSEFDYAIEYKPGSTNFIADYLSHAHSDPEARPEIPTSAVHSVSLTDPLAPQPALAAMLQPFNPTLKDGIITLPTAPSQEIICKVWALAHSIPFSGHSGAIRTIMRASSAISWPGMPAALTKLCQACPLCQKLRALPPTPASLASTRASAPMESVFADFIGPLRLSSGHRYILVMVDRFSHYCCLVPTKDTSAQTAADGLLNAWICRFGLFRLLTTDGGSSFSAATFKDALALLESNHHISAPYHPEGHGVVERLNYDIEQILRAFLRDHPTWHDLVPSVAFALNTGYSRTLGISPFEVIHGFAPRLPIHQALGSDLPTPNPDSDPLTVSDSLVSRSLILIPKIRALQDKLHEDYIAAQARKAQGQTSFPDGSFVLLQRPRPEKLLLQWSGPFQVISQDPQTHIYVIQDLITTQQHQAPASHLHAFNSGTLSPEQIKLEAAPQEEFFVDRILGHAYNDEGILCLRILWLGYPEQDPTDPSAWLTWPNARHLDLAKAYIKAKALKPKIAPHPAPSP